MMAWEVHEEELTRLAAKHKLAMEVAKAGNSLIELPPSEWPRCHMCIQAPYWGVLLLVVYLLPPICPPACPLHGD